MIYVFSTSQLWLQLTHHIVSLSTVLDIKERRTLNLIVAPVVYCHCRRQVR